MAYSGHVVDPYVDANGFLKNTLGIVDADTLEKYEAELVFVRQLELVNAPVTGKYDTAHICALHRHLSLGGRNTGD
ncbi:hypothetical protein OpiT1DRAFT_04997 [Opitutaceae bacterium TAV1]|nr:hypothetical protein OpiT1DRAFT_04997 [Opitutaceae bacterium TAV1]